MNIEDLLKGEGLQGLMQQAQQMQSQMQQARAKAQDKTVVGESGGGMVKVTANGNMEVLSVFIDPLAASPEEDLEMLQDLIVAATNDALRRAKQAVEAELGPLAQMLKSAGMGL